MKLEAFPLSREDLVTEVRECIRQTIWDIYIEGLKKTPPVASKRRTLVTNQDVT